MKNILILILCCFVSTISSQTLLKPDHVFDGKEMHEVGFLIANGVAESFALRIDEISLQE